MERTFQESKVTDKSITKIINSQVDIKLGQFIQELNILTKIKSRKAAILKEIPPEVLEDKEI